MLSLLKSKSSTIIFFILLLLIIPAVAALFHPGFFLTDDGNWMVIRLAAFYNAIRNGQFPVRFLLQLNHGYGYPVADFLYPLFLYMGVPIHVLGINFQNTVKILFGISLIGSGIFSYTWLRRIASRYGAFIGAILYVIFPYHLYDIYVRGSIGEAVALAIVPFVLWQAERNRLFLTSIGIALLILAHNSLAVLFLPLLLLYVWFRKLFSLKRILFLVIYALGLSAFFWLPALYDKQFTVFDSTSVADFTKYFVTWTNGYLVGWITVVILLLSLPLLFFKRSIIHLFFWVVALVSLFLCLPQSSSIWTSLHIVPYFQFPYRMISLTILSISYLSAMEIDSMQQKFRLVAIIFLLSVGYISSWNLLFPKIYQYYPDSFYSTNQDSTTVKNEYMPKWVQNVPTQSTGQTAIVTQGNGVLTDVLAKGNKVAMNAVITSSSTVQINVVYFPGWSVFVDGKRTAFSYDNPQGVLMVALSPGIHSIQAVFSETPFRLIADSISLITLGLVLYGFLKRKIYAKK